MPTESVSNSVSLANAGTSFTLTLSAPGAIALPTALCVLGCGCVCVSLLGACAALPSGLWYPRVTFGTCVFVTALAGGVQICTEGSVSELGAPTVSVHTLVSQRSSYSLLLKLCALIL